MTWILKYFHPPEPYTFDISIDFGGMGSGIAGSIGSALAKPEQFTVCITGDGCLSMHGQYRYTGFIVL